MPRPQKIARRMMVLASAAILGCSPAATPGSAATSDGALVLNGEGWALFPEAGDTWDLVPGGERTFALWVRYTRPQYHAKILYKNTTPEIDPQRGYVIFVHQYSSSLGFWHRSGIPLDESGYTQAGTTGTRKIGDGDWHHVAVVQRDTLVEAWVDGRLEFVENIAATLPHLDNDAPPQLGWGITDRINFAGEMDEFSLWHRALSGREIRRLRYRSPAPDAAGLVGYWPMDDGAGNVIEDRTGSGLDGDGTALEWSTASRPLGPPFQERPSFYLLVAGLALALLYGILRLYGRRLEGQKKKLEQQVEARVADLARTNEEKDQALALVASQAERLKEVNDTRSRFFTNISHEFRTPLSLIVGPLSDTLEKQGSDLEEDTRQAIQAALRSGRRLGHLTGQLLDLARLESETLRLDTTLLDLRDLLGDIAQSFSMVSGWGHVAFKVDLPEEPMVVEGDTHRLETVFGNLLSNALRFTPAGSEVLLRAVRHEQSVTVEVRDQGPGIEIEEQGRVFERFHQTPAGVRRAGGMGIGLALVRELVELHGGHVRLDSTPGQGAAFWVTLPLADHVDGEALPGPASRASRSTVELADLPHLEVGHPPGPEAEADPDEADRALRPLVLVVEDHPELRAFLRSHLGRHFRVSDAPDGSQALERVRETPPDVIVSDVMMPEVDGLQLLQALREDPDLESIPLVLLSAKAEVEDRIAGLTQGADDYLAKPFEPQELTARIGSILAARQRLRRRLATDSGAEPGPGGPGTSVGETPPAAEPDAAEKLRHRLTRALEANLGDPTFTVSDLAAKVAMERTGLYKLMTAELGVSPSDFMRDIRLERASQLLWEGNTVAEVAYAVGYGSVSSFSRRFHERFQCRPGRWARERAPNG